MKWATRLSFFLSEDEAASERAKHLSTSALNVYHRAVRSKQRSRNGHHSRRKEQKNAADGSDKCRGKSLLHQPLVDRPVPVLARSFPLQTRDCGCVEGGNDITLTGEQSAALRSRRHFDQGDARRRTVASLCVPIELRVSLPVCPPAGRPAPRVPPRRPNSLPPRLLPSLPPASFLDSLTLIHRLGNRQLSARQGIRSSCLPPLRRSDHHSSLNSIAPSLKRPTHFNEFAEFTME